jgi:hypothetical protein
MHGDETGFTAGEKEEFRRSDSGCPSAPGKLLA